MKQPGGKEAKEFAKSIVLGKNVTVHVKSVDVYKRKVAIIELQEVEGVIFNEKIIEQGFAWHYKQYSDDDLYRELEEKAKSLRVGIWGMSESPIAPWDWRKSRKRKSEL